MTTFGFIARGVPVPQGSKQPWGGEANPHLKSWRATVADAAAEFDVIDGPVAVTATFVFPRPRSHYRTGKFSHLLRDDAPKFHSSTPDLDKLQRAVGDALKGVVLRDDSQIVNWIALKIYGDKAHASIGVTAL